MNRFTPFILLAALTVGGLASAAQTPSGADDIAGVLRQSAEAAEGMASIASSGSLACATGEKDCAPSLSERAKAVKAVLNGISNLSAFEITCDSYDSYHGCYVGKSYLDVGAVKAMWQATLNTISPLIEAGDIEGARKLLEGFWKLPLAIERGYSMPYRRKISVMDASQVRGIVQAALDLLPQPRRRWWPFGAR